MAFLNNYLIYLDISILVILGIFLLRGFIVGTKRMIITSVLKWVLILILVLFSSQIADVLVNIIKIKGVTLDKYLFDLIVEKMELTVESGSYLETLITALVHAVVTLVTVYLSITVVTFVIYPLISLILAIVGVRKIMSDNHKSLPNRAIGMLIGAFVTVIIFVVCYMPIYGSISLAGTIEEDYKIIEESTNKDGQQQTNNLALETNTEKSSSFILNAGDDEDYNIFERYMDNFFVVSMNSTKVKIIKEYYNFRPFIPTIAKLASKDKGLSDISSEDFNTLINVLTNTDMKEIIIPVALEFGIAKGTFEKNDIEITNQDIHDLNWGKEIEYLDEFLESLKDTYQLYEKYQNNLKQILGDEKFSPVITKNIEELFKMSLIKTYGPDLANKALDKSLENMDQSTAKDLLEMVTFTEKLIDDIKILCDSAYDLYWLGFIDKEIKPDFNQEKTTNAVNDLVNGIFDLSFIKDNEPKIIDLICDLLKLEEYLEETEISFDEVNWEEEPTSLANIIIEYGKLFNGKDLTKFDIDQICEGDFTSLVDAICNSDLVVHVIIPAVNKLLKDKISTTEFAELADIIELPQNKELLKSDLDLILKMLPIIKDTTDLTTIINEEEKIQNLLVDMINLSFVKGNEQNLIKKLITTFDFEPFLTSYGIELNYEVTSWKNEMMNLGTLLYQANQIGIENLPTMIENLNEENKEKIKEVLISIINLELIQTSVPKIVDQELTKAGLENWKSEWIVAQQTTFTKELWEAEINNLVDILAIYQTANLDLNNIQTEDVEIINQLLKKMADTRSLKMGNLVTIVNDELTKKTKQNKEYLTEPADINWPQEIDAIFGTNGVFVLVRGINENTTYQEYGIILDKLKELKMLNNGYYDFIIDYINELPAYKNSQITIDISKETLMKVDSFEQELAIIDEIDFNAETQSSGTIDKLMNSVLFRSQVEIYINDILVKNNLDIYYDNNYLSSDIDAVNEKIKVTKSDEDPNNDWSWTKEIDLIERFSNALDIAIAEPTRVNAENLKNTSSDSVITLRVLERVKVMYPALGALL